MHTQGRHTLDAVMATGTRRRSTVAARNRLLKQIQQSSIDRLLQLLRARSIIGLQQRRHPHGGPSRSDACPLPKPRQPAASLYRTPTKRDAFHTFSTRQGSKKATLHIVKGTSPTGARHDNLRAAAESQSCRGTMDPSSELVIVTCADMPLLIHGTNPFSLS